MKFPSRQPLAIRRSNPLTDAHRVSRLPRAGPKRHEEALSETDLGVQAGRTLKRLTQSDEIAGPQKNITVSGATDKRGELYPTFLYLRVSVSGRGSVCKR
jgi:hypothetical protein